MAFYGNPVGGFCYPKTYILTDENGTEMATGVVVGEKTVFTATDNDVRQGLVYAGDEGVSTGLKDIPAYHTTEMSRYIDNGEAYTIPLSNLDLYDYTKLQAIICKYNTSTESSVCAVKVVISDKVYDVNSSTPLASVVKDNVNKTINLGITNNSGAPCVLRVFTYKEI